MNLLKFLVINPADNVGVALRTIEKGETVEANGKFVTACEEIAAGHKMAICPISAGECVTKYGYTIGSAKSDISAGSWVHTHNLKTNLNDKLAYPSTSTPPALGWRTSPASAF